MMTVKIKPHARRKARSLVLQALYQWQLTNEEIIKIKLQFIDKINPKKIDEVYFDELLSGTIKNITIINETITPVLDRKLNELDEVELAIIRLAVYELKYRLDVPYRVIINEALELTKKFGSIEGYKYVNGVLDKVARLLRDSEVNLQSDQKR